MISGAYRQSKALRRAGHAPDPEPLLSELESIIAELRGTPSSEKESHEHASGGDLLKEFFLTRHGIGIPEDPDREPATGLAFNQALECLYDEVRTKMFLLGLSDAVREKTRGKEETRVLDAGCGPVPIFGVYAALISPKIRAVCLESNSDSAETARRVVNAFSLSDRVEVICCDARHFRNPAKFDICVSETMDSGLMCEPILPIMKSLRNTLNEDSIVLPSEVSVACALVPAEDVVNPSRKVWIDGSEIPVFEGREISSVCWNTSFDLEYIDLSADIPRLKDAGIQYVVLNTRVKAGQYEIEPSASKITLPIFVSGLYSCDNSGFQVSCSLHGGRRIRLSYRPPQPVFAELI